MPLRLESVQTPVAEGRPWHRHWPNDVPRSIDYPEIRVQELLRRTADRHPDRIAVTFYGKSMSYRALDTAADRFAAGLRRIGMKPGERVSLVLPNTPHFPIALFGTLRAGGIVVQTNPLYTPRELENLYRDAGVETVVVLDRFWPNVARAKPATSVQRIVVGDAVEFLRAPLRQLYPLKKRKDLKKAGHWPLVIPSEPWVHRFAELAAVIENEAKDEPELDRQRALRARLGDFFLGFLPGLARLLAHRLLLLRGRGLRKRRQREAERGGNQSCNQTIHGNTPWGLGDRRSSRTSGGRSIFMGSYGAGWRI